MLFDDRAYPLLRHCIVNYLASYPQIYSTDTNNRAERRSTTKWVVMDRNSNEFWLEHHAESGAAFCRRRHPFCWTLVVVLLNVTLI